jgi:hypothetical protein
LYACKSQQNNAMQLCIDGGSPTNENRITFSELYAAKEIDGKTITLEGKFSYGFEDVALYPGTTDKQAVWLELDNRLTKHDSALQNLMGKRVAITGTVSLTRKGHLNSYFCTLYNISCIQPQ